uniref:Uncharacterized protein n=1 Tax=Physcomitrium patens TaxID=3218 RepID=A0A2K1IYK8_PHYPA|nr:hypothetical protein PHYPA_024168 [Physcomitrium patens]
MNRIISSFSDVNKHTLCCSSCSDTNLHTLCTRPFSQTSSGTNSFRRYAPVHLHDLCGEQIPTTPH